jgi:hypothetical protein
VTTLAVPVAALEKGKKKTAFFFLSNPHDAEFSLRDRVSIVNDVSILAAVPWLPQG